MDYSGRCQAILNTCEPQEAHAGDILLAKPVGNEGDLIGALVTKYPVGQSGRWPFLNPHPYARALLILNLGGELMYAMEQRLAAKCVAQDRAMQVLEYLAQTLFHTEEQQPKPLPTLLQLRDFYHHMLAESISKLFVKVVDQGSMGKLCQNALMALKAQLMRCTSPRELLDMSFNHIDALLMIVDSDELRQWKVFLMAAHLSTGELQRTRHCLLNFLQDQHTKVSLLVKSGVQNQTGSISLPRGITAIDLRIAEDHPDRIFCVRTEVPPPRSGLGNNMFRPGKPLEEARRGAALVLIQRACVSHLTAVRSRLHELKAAFHAREHLHAARIIQNLFRKVLYRNQKQRKERKKEAAKEEVEIRQAYAVTVQDTLRHTTTTHYMADVLEAPYPRCRLLPRTMSELRAVSLEINYAHGRVNTPTCLSELDRAAMAEEINLDSTNVTNEHVMYLCRRVGSSNKTTTSEEALEVCRTHAILPRDFCRLREPFERSET